MVTSHNLFFVNCEGCTGLYISSNLEAKSNNLTGRPKNDLIVVDDQVDADVLTDDFKATQKKFTVDFPINNNMVVNTTTITTTSPLNGHYAADLNSSTTSSATNNNSHLNIIANSVNRHYANFSSNFVGVGGGFKLPADPTASSATTNAQQMSSTTPDGKSIQELKRSMRLDFSSPDTLKKSLATPEILSVLKFASPDLEKLITQQLANGGGGNTPTPTQFFYPKNVTTEQEQYARGFVDALNQLHALRGSYLLPPNLLSPGFVTSTIQQQDGKDENSKRESIKTTVASVEQLLRTLTGGGAWTSSLSPYISSSATSSVQTLPTFPTTIPSTSNNNDVIFLPLSPKRANNLSSDVKNDPQLPVVNKNSDFASSSSASKRPLVENSISFSPQNKRFKTEPPSKNSDISSSSSFLDQHRHHNQITTNALLPPIVGENLTLTTSDTPPPSAAHYVTLSTTRMGSSLPTTGKTSSEKRQYSAARVKTERNSSFVGNTKRGSSGMASSSAAVILPSTSNAIVVSSAASSYSERPISAASNEGGSKIPNEDDEEDDDDSYFDDKASGTTASGTPCSTPSLRHALNVGPIDPIVQEKLKLERKRARNRLAASKCRRRKLEVIDRLSDNVREITSKNEQLQSKIDLFRCDIAEIRLKIEIHKKHGCNI